MVPTSINYCHSASTSFYKQGGEGRVKKRTSLICHHLNIHLPNIAAIKKNGILSIEEFSIVWKNLIKKYLIGPWGCEQ